MMGDRRCTPLRSCARGLPYSLELHNERRRAVGRRTDLAGRHAVPAHCGPRDETGRGLRRGYSRRRGWGEAPNILGDQSANSNLVSPMIAIRKSRIKEGSPHPKGATWDGAGTNFAVFSVHATRVEVCIFDE